VNWRYRFQDWEQAEEWMLVCMANIMIHGPINESFFEHFTLKMIVAVFFAKA